MHLIIGADVVFQSHRAVQHMVQVRMLMSVIAREAIQLPAAEAIHARVADVQHMRLTPA